MRVYPRVLWASCVRVLQTFLGQKNFGNKQNTQFSPKNFRKTCVLIFEQTALNT